METKKVKTLVFNVVILDRSGSMSSIRKAALTGFNETLAAIKRAQEEFADSQDHYVSLVTFCSCTMESVFDKVPVAEARMLTLEDYVPCCGTPLYDAMGFTINSLRSHVEAIDDAVVVVTVITDGEENASREFSGAAIKKLVEQVSGEGWTFSYMGANQDVFVLSMSLSFKHAVNFEAWAEETIERMQFESDKRQTFFNRLHEEKTRRPYMRRSRNENAAMANAVYDEMAGARVRYTPDHIDALRPNEVFVFGSNLAGNHGAGAARAAVRKFGAVMGQGVGLAGQSYAIPTMHGGVEEIRPYVDEFIAFARQHPELTFYVTRIGCGIAGFTPAQIAPLFKGARTMANVILPRDFVALM